MAQRPGQVEGEAVESLRRNGLGHRREGHVVNGDDLRPAERRLVAVEEEVRCEQHVVTVEEPEHGFDEGPQQTEGPANRKQEPGRNLVDSEPHLPAARRRRLFRGEKSSGVKVVNEAVVTIVEFFKEVPLVPPDPGHTLEERVDVDSNRRHLLAADDAAMKAPPARTESAGKVPEDGDEETRGGGETAEHCG